MTRKQEVLERVNSVLSRIDGVDEAQVKFSGSSQRVSRFNNNTIHQNLEQNEETLTVEVIIDGHPGSATTNRLDDDGTSQVVEQAIQHAALLADEGGEADERFADPTPLQAVNSYCEATAQATPAQRADLCGETIRQAQAAGVQAAGTCAVALNELAIVNSRGVQAYEAGTTAFYRSLVTRSVTSTGYADQLSRDIKEIDAAAVGREALERATWGKDGEVSVLEPGAYTTIFHPYAVADLIRFFGYLAFGAQAVQEGRSFLSERLGEQVLGENISIWDDAFDARGLVTSFDSQGVGKQRVTIIDHGVAKSPVYDIKTAAKEDRQSTGHARRPGSWGTGPEPANLVMAAGDSSLEELIASTRRGVLVTRFHYTHAPDPRAVVATGTTRDGTFLIENGSISKRLRNVRFEQNLVQAFNQVSGISSQPRLTRDWWSTFDSVLPAVRIEDFHFTGTGQG